MTVFETLIYEKADAVACVTLNRPAVMNIHNMAMRDDLYELLSAIREDDDVRAILLKGAGEKAFCAGADLTEFLTAPPPVTARAVRFDADLWERFTTMPQPLLLFRNPKPVTDSILLTEPPARRPLPAGRLIGSAGF